MYLFNRQKKLKKKNLFYLKKNKIMNLRKIFTFKIINTDLFLIFYSLELNFDITTLLEIN